MITLEDSVEYTCQESLFVIMDGDGEEFLQLVNDNVIYQGFDEAQKEFLKICGGPTVPESKLIPGTDRYEILSLSTYLHDKDCGCH